jgi:hypothetical protein
MKRTVDLLHDHDVQEIVKFQQYLDDLEATGATEEFYRRYQDYLGLSDPELNAILSRRAATQKEK